MSCPETQNAELAQCAFCSVIGSVEFIVNHINASHNDNTTEESGDQGADNCGK